MILSYKNISKALMLSVFMISSGYGHDHLDGHHHDGSHHDGCNHDHQVEQSNQQGGNQENFLKIWIKC